MYREGLRNRPHALPLCLKRKRHEGVAGGGCLNFTPLPEHNMSVLHARPAIPPAPRDRDLVSHRWHDLSGSLNPLLIAPGYILGHLGGERRLQTAYTTMITISQIASIIAFLFFFRGICRTPRRSGVCRNGCKACRSSF